MAPTGQRVENKRLMETNTQSGLCAVFRKGGWKLNKIHVHEYTICLPKGNWLNPLWTRSWEPTFWEQTFWKQTFKLSTYPQLLYLGNCKLPNYLKLSRIGRTDGTEFDKGKCFLFNVGSWRKPESLFPAEPTAGVFYLPSTQSKLVRLW